MRRKVRDVEHVCKDCAGGNPFPEGTMRYQQYELSLACHRAFFAAATALGAPAVLRWLTRRLT